MNEQYIALTGATGVLAKHLVKQFLDDGYKIIFFGRSSPHESLEQRIHNHVGKEYSEQLKGCKYHEFTLSHVDSETLSYQLRLQKPLCFVHAAANLSFKKSDRDAVMKDNYQATKEIYDICRLLEIPFCFISTAFIHGSRAGLLKENELIRPDKFNNYYEESKFLSEQYLHTAKHTKCKTIIVRPGILISKEKSHDYNFGFFVLAKSLIRLRKNIGHFVTKHPRISKMFGIRIADGGVLSTPIPFVFARSCSMDLVSTEWVSVSIAKIIYRTLKAEDTTTGIYTFQLSNPVPVPFGDILKHTSAGARISFWAIPAPEWASKTYVHLLIALGLLVPFLRDFTKKISYYEHYITTSFTHDVANTLSIVPEETHSMAHEIFYEHTDFFFKK